MFIINCNIIQIYTGLLQSLKLFFLQDYKSVTVLNNDTRLHSESSQARCVYIWRRYACLQVLNLLHLSSTCPPHEDVNVYIPGASKFQLSEAPWKYGLII